MGIITLGLGLGGFGTFAAMFHVTNHSLCKSLGFCSAGRLGQLYGTHDITKMKGVLRAAPVWGGGFFVALLVLIGVAPFAIFMSEFQILRTAYDTGALVALVLFLVGTCIIFIGALRYAVAAAWEKPDSAVAPERAGVLDYALVLLPLTALLVLGLYLPDWLSGIFTHAAAIIGGAP
jgi:hydrogenase-4 component F